MPATQSPAATAVSRPAAYISLLWLIVIGALALSMHSAPRPVPADAPDTLFSAKRAMVHVEAIAQTPRPAGTPAHAETRRYLVDQLEAMGIPVEVQTAQVHWRPGALTTVHNVIGRIRGTGSGEAVVLMAHYDSVTFGPGASDDAVGCAVILETARALIASGDQLTNDVILLLTDAEEGRRLGGWGLRGAIGFVEQHPWMDDVRVVLNFDCRGNRGPAYMYESSENSGVMIRALRESGAAVIATSLGYDVYSNMPVNSDFSVFKDAGVAGLNFGYIKGLPYYHTALDTPENVSRASLQHHGEYALPLTRYFGNHPLDVLEAPNAVYFNTLGTHFVHYPVSWAIPLSMFAMLFFLGVMAWGFVRGHLTAAGVVTAMLGFLICTAATSALAAAVFLIGYQLRGVYILYQSDAFVAGLAAFGIGLIALFAAASARRIPIADLAAGATAWWAIVLLIVGLRFFGASYIPTWNLIFGALTLLVLYRSRDALPTPGTLALLAALALPPVLITVPVFYGMHTSLELVFSAGTLLILMLLMGLLLPHLRLIGQGRIWFVPLRAWGVAAVCVAFALMSLGFDERQPKMNCLNYMMRADSAEAYWISCDDATDEWTAQFFPDAPARKPVTEFLPNHDGEYLKAPAPLLDLDPPAVLLVSDENDGGTRRLHLHVSSPRLAPRLMLYADPGTRVLSAEVDGTPLMTIDEDIWFIDYTALPHDGINLRIEIPVGAALGLLAVDNDYQLPGLIGEEYEPRPDWMIPLTNTVDFNQGFIKSDETHVARRYEF